MNLSRKVVATAVVIALLLSILRLIGPMQNNKWSVQYWKTIRESSFHYEINALRNMETHKRANAWLSQRALANDNSDAALSLLPLLRRDSLLDMRAKGKILVSSGDVKAGLDVWQNVGDYNSIVDYAEILEQTGDLANAEQAWLVAQSIAPDGVVQPFTEFLIRNGRSSEAVAYLGNDSREEQSSKDRASQLIKLGGLARQEQDWDTANAIYQELVQMPGWVVDGYVGLGWLAFQRGDGIDVALKFFDLAADADLKDGRAYYEAAMVLARDARYSEAESKLEMALALQPDDRTIAMLFANIALLTGEYEIAVERYQDLLRRFPNSASIYYELAWAYRSLDDSVSAIDAIERSLEIVEAPVVAYHIRAGTIYEWAGYLDLAIVQYRLALEVEPNDQIAIDGVNRLSGE